VTLADDKIGTSIDRNDLIARLRELIAALDSRVPHPERDGELQVTMDAEALKQRALERIAELAN